ncbi:right-handed parallel beta-helix repeat-containing protein, partial [Leucobacter sp. M11]|nr:right-handed parallel beta-helix repeat-containing protein [Leucobacter sp. M11]
MFTVTDGSDTSGSAPQPGSLRDALQQISAASTQGGAPPTDYTVAFDPSVSLVTLTGGLEVELGSGAQSLTIEGDATIDLSDNDVDFTGVGLSGAMTVSGLTITGDSTWSNPVAQSTTLTGVTRTGYGETLFQSRESDTLTNVIATNSTFTLEAPEDVSDTYALTVSGDSLDSSRFTDAPFTVHAGASGRNDLTVRNTRMTGNEQQTAFGVYTYAAEAGAPVHLTIEGSEITDNPSGGVQTTSAETVTVTDTQFQNNGRAGALNLSMEGGTASWVHVANSTFRQNLGDFAGLTVKDTVGSILVTGSEFSENDSAVAGTGEGGGVFILARNASEDEDPSGAAELPAGMVQGAIVIQENTFANNASMSGAAGVHVESFLSGGIEPTLIVERNQFEGNRSTFDANDVSVSMSGMDEEDRATIALRGNSFLGSAGGPSDPDNDSGRRSVSVMSAENTSIDVLNNTFSAATGEDALLSIGTLATGSDLALTHNTFSGGGLAIGSLQEVGSDALRVHATVFDTAHDPLSIDEGAQPAVLGDVQTVTASPNLPGAAPATSEGLALAEPGNNGGPTLTMLPAEGSTLIDAVTADASYAAADQRGVPRPQGPAADIGAVEIEEPLDDDVITLDQDLSVVEGEDAVITALRTGPSLSEGSATLTAHDGTALLDTDYSRATGTVTFPAQDTRAPEPQRATLTIPTVKRSGAQGERSFTVTLTEPSEGAVLGEPVTVTVTI